MADDSVIYVPVAPSLEGFTAPVVAEAVRAARMASRQMSSSLDGEPAGRNGARGIHSGLNPGQFRATGTRIGTELGRGLRASAEPERAGREQGHRYARAFASAARSGFRGMTAAFGVVASSASSIVRNIGTAATVISLAARITRGFALSLTAASAGLSMIAGQNLLKLAGALKWIARIVGMLARDIARVTAALIVLSAVAGVLGTMTRMARMAGMAIIGIGTAIGLVSAGASVVGGVLKSAFGPQLIAAISAAGMALVGVAGAAAGILGPAMAVGKIAFKGMADGAKEFNEQFKDSDKLFNQMIGQRMGPLLTAFRGLKQEITGNFTQSLSDPFVWLGGALDGLKPKLGGLATTLGNVGGEIAGTLNFSAANGEFDKMISASDTFFQNFLGESGIAGLTGSLVSFAAMAADTFKYSGESINGVLLDISDWFRNITPEDLTGAVEHLRGVFATLQQTFQNVMSVAGPLFNAFRQLGAESATTLAPGFRSVGAAIAQATPGLVEIARNIMPALSQVMTNLAPILPVLVDAFTPWSEVLAVVAPHVASLITFLGPFAPMLLGAALAVKMISVGMVAWNAAMFASSVAQGIFIAVTGRSTAGIHGNTVALAAHRVATVASTVATSALSVAMGILTSPITLIILAIAAFVGALVLLYKKNETFRNFVQKAWAAIKDAAVSAWNNFIKPAFEQFVAALKKVGEFALWLWNTAIVPAFNAMKVVIGIWWAAVKIYFSTLITVLKAIGTAALWLWNNAIVPAFNGIKAAIGIWWAAVQIYFNAAKAVFSAIGAAAMWLWNNAIVPAFNGIKMAVGIWWAAVQVWFNAAKAVFFAIGDAAMFLWNNAIVPAFNGIKAAADAVGAVFSLLWNSVIKPVWEAFGNGIKLVIDNVVKPAFEGIKTALSSVGDFFGSVVEGIKTVWDKLKGYVAAPINFVIKTVWNDGLRVAWNKVAGFLPGLKPMDPLNEVKFAHGGPVPMGQGAVRGKDSVHGLLMPDEHVWDVKDVDRAGGHGAMYGMREAVMSGTPFTWTPSGVYAGGGDPDLGLQAFKDGGAVEPGAALSPMPGEGGLQDIAKLMGRIIMRLWPKGVSSIGGYRPPDGYNEHSSGRALDVMVNDAKTGTEVKDWSMANSPKYPVQHTIWDQKMWYPPNRSEGMPDRGSPTQNHMDHDHIWYQPQAVNPNIVPDNLVGFDGMTSEDKLNVLKKKIKEILDKLLNPIQDKIADLVGAPPPEWLGIPSQVLTQTKDKAVDALFGFAGGLGEKLAEAYESAKDIGKTLANVVSNPVGAIGGLLRDTGGYIPPGTSVVRNETGRPEAVLNWDQLEEVRKLLEATGQAAGTSFLNDTLDFFGFGQLYSAVSGALAPPAADQSAAADPSAATTATADQAKTGGTGTYTDPTYGNGATVSPTEVPLETKMPEFAPEGWEKYPFAITEQAKKMGLPKRAAIIGNAAALVEVGDPMKMYANNAVPDSLNFPHDAVSSDHDSIGLFQQRANGAWGTTADRMDPHRSAEMFYNALKGVDGWETMDMGAAAQAVQRSAFPEKYAGQVGRATELVDKFALYDNGGWLNPGLNLAMNKTGSPEAILTNAQWGYIDDLLESLPSASTFKAVADVPVNVRSMVPPDDDNGDGLAGAGAGRGEYHAHYHTEDVTSAVLLDKREQRRLARSDALVGGW